MATFSTNLSVDDPGFSFLQHNGFEVTSRKSTSYNCISWAAGDTEYAWWPVRHPKVHWPDGAPYDESVSAFSKAFETLGYVQCNTPEFEKGFEKVAIFQKGGKVKHAARQIISGPNKGRWTSKMGPEVDIVHDLNGVSGSYYGAIVLIMRRGKREGCLPRVFL